MPHVWNGRVCSAMDTRKQNGPAGYAPGFRFAGFNISLSARDADPWPRGLYIVDDATRAWDGTTRRFALYSERHNVFSYCDVRVTGRRVRAAENFRLTVRVDFDGIGEANHPAILLRPDGRFFNLADVALLP